MRHYCITFIWITILGTLMLVGCTSEPAATPLPTTPSASPIPTEVAASPAPVQSPTPTGTPALPLTPTLALPVLAGTPVPLPQEPITPDNVDQIRELAIWGKGRIEQLVYSPDGKILAVGTTAGVWLYEAETLAELHFINTGNFVSSLAFTSDSQKLITHIDTSTLATWNVTTGELLNEIVVHEQSQNREMGSSSQSVLSAGARLLATTNDEISVNLWDAVNGNRLQTLKIDDESSAIKNLVISSDQKLLATGLGNATIRLWDLSTGTLLHTLTGFDRSSYSLALSPSGSESMLLAAGGREGKIWLWDASSGQLVRVLEGSPGTFPGTLAFSGDGALLAAEVAIPSSAPDSPYIATLQIWRVADGVLLHTLTLDVEVITELTFSPDNMLLILGTPTGMVQRWNIQTGRLVDNLIGFNSSLGQIGQAPPLPAFLPNGDLFISNPFNYQIELWDLKTGKLLEVLIGHKSAVTNLVISADGNKLVSAELWDNTIRIWDPATGQNLGSHTFYTYTGEDKALAISPDGQLIASGESVRGRNPGAVYSITQLDNWLYFLPGNGSINPAFSPDGQKIASVSGVISVTVSKAETGELLQILETELPSNALTFSPDSQMLAIGTQGGAIQFWDTTIGVLFNTLNSETNNEVASLAYSPDGKIFAAGMKNTPVPVSVLTPTIWLWDTETGTLLKTVEGYQANIFYLIFSPDGTLLITASLDGTMRLWGIPPE